MGVDDRNLVATTAKSDAGHQEHFAVEPMLFVVAIDRRFGCDDDHAALDTTVDGPQDLGNVGGWDSQSHVKRHLVVPP
jgi:hypothetical protein